MTTVTPSQKTQFFLQALNPRATTYQVKDKYTLVKEVNEKTLGN